MSPGEEGGEEEGNEVKPDQPRLVKRMTIHACLLSFQDVKLRPTTSQFY